MEEQPDVLDQMALSTGKGAVELMHWFRQEGHSNVQAFCIMTHTLVTLWKAFPEPMTVKNLAVRISRRIFSATRGPLEAVVMERQDD